MNNKIISVFLVIAVTCLLKQYNMPHYPQCDEVQSNNMIVAAIYNGFNLAMTIAKGFVNIVLDVPIFILLFLLQLFLYSHILFFKINIATIRLFYKKLTLTLVFMIIFLLICFTVFTTVHTISNKLAGHVNAITYDNRTRHQRRTSKIMCKQMDSCSRLMNFIVTLDILGLSVLISQIKYILMTIEKNPGPPFGYDKVYQSLKKSTCNSQIPLKTPLVHINSGAIKEKLAADRLMEHKLTQLSKKIDKTHYDPTEYVFDQANIRNENKKTKARIDRKFRNQALLVQTHVDLELIPNQVGDFKVPENVVPFATAYQNTPAKHYLSQGGDKTLMCRGDANPLAPKSLKKQLMEMKMQGASDFYRACAYYLLVDEMYDCEIEFDKVPMVKSNKDTLKMLEGLAKNEDNNFLDKKGVFGEDLVQYENHAQVVNIPHVNPLTGIIATTNIREPQLDPLTHQPMVDPAGRKIFHNKKYADDATQDVVVIATRPAIDVRKRERHNANRLESIDEIDNIVNPVTATDHFSGEKQQATALPARYRGKYDASRSLDARAQIVYDRCSDNNAFFAVLANTYKNIPFNQKMLQIARESYGQYTDRTLYRAIDFTNQNNFLKLFLTTYFNPNSLRLRAYFLTIASTYCGALNEIHKVMDTCQICTSLNMCEDNPIDFTTNRDWFRPHDATVFNVNIIEDYDNAAALHEAAKRHNQEQHAKNGNINDHIVFEEYSKQVLLGEAKLSQSGSVIQYSQAPMPTHNYLEIEPTLLVKDSASTQAELFEFVCLESRENTVVECQGTTYLRHDDNAMRNVSEVVNPRRIAEYQNLAYNIGSGGRSSTEGFRSTALGDAMEQAYSTTANTPNEILQLLANQSSAVDNKNISSLISLYKQTKKNRVLSGATTLALKAFGYAISKTPTPNVHTYCHGFNNEYDEQARVPIGNYYPLSENTNVLPNIQANAMTVDGFIRWNSHGDSNDVVNPNEIDRTIALIPVDDEMMGNRSLLAASTLTALKYPFRYIGRETRTTNSDRTRVTESRAGVYADLNAYRDHVGQTTTQVQDLAMDTTVTPPAPFADRRTVGRVDVAHNPVMEATVADVRANFQNMTERVISNATRMKIDGADRVIYIIMNSANKNHDLTISAGGVTLAVPIRRVGADGRLVGLTANDVNIAAYVETAFEELSADHYCNLVEYMSTKGLICPAQIGTAQKITALYSTYYCTKPSTVTHAGRTETFNTRHNDTNDDDGDMDTNDMMRDIDIAVSNTINGLFQRMIPIARVRANTQYSLYLPGSNDIMKFFTILGVASIDAEAVQCTYREKFHQGLTYSMVQYSLTTMRGLNFFTNMLGISEAMIVPHDNFTPKQLTICKIKLGYGLGGTICHSSDYSDTEFSNLAQLTTKLIPQRISLNYSANLEPIDHNVGIDIRSMERPAIYVNLTPKALTNDDGKTRLKDINWTKIKMTDGPNGEVRQAAVHAMEDGNAAAKILKNFGTIYSCNDNLAKFSRANADGRGTLSPISASILSPEYMLDKMRAAGMSQENINYYLDQANDYAIWSNPFIYDMDKMSEQTVVICVDYTVKNIDGYKFLSITLHTNKEDIFDHNLYEEYDMEYTKWRTSGTISGETPEPSLINQQQANPITINEQGQIVDTGGSTGIGNFNRIPADNLNI